MSIDWRDYSGRDDPEQRWGLYRICPGETEPELVATCATPEAVGTALVQLGGEGEWEDCPFGLLDRMPECEECEGRGRVSLGAPAHMCEICNGTGIKPTGTWIILPFLSSPKNLQDAGRVLRSGRADVRSTVGGKTRMRQASCPTCGGRGLIRDNATPDAIPVPAGMTPDEWAQQIDVSGGRRRCPDCQGAGVR